SPPMRLPNLDVSLLVVHYLFSAAGGNPAHAPAPRPGPAPRQRPGAMADATRMRANAPVQASLAAALEQAARAGLLDCHGAGRRGCLPTSAPSRGRRRSRRLARHADPTARAADSAPPPAPAATPGPCNATLIPAAWAATWERLPVCQRADLARAMAQARRLGVSIEDSLTTVEGEGNARTGQWLSQSVDMFTRDNMTSTGNPGPAQRTDHVDLYWALHARRQDTAEDGACTAERLATHASALTLTDREEYFYQANRLADLFDPDWLRDPPRSDLALLRAVHTALAVRFPDYRAPLLDPHAIAVALQLRQRCETRLGNDETHIEINRFTSEVHAEIAAETLAARLIPTGNAPPAHGGAWFDGIAVRGAHGRHLADLARELAWRQPGLADAVEERTGAVKREMLHPRYTRPVPVERHRQLESWLRKRLGDLLESTRFPFGTPAQSIDTILLRLADAHGVPRSPGTDFATVMRDFNRLCAAWRAAPAYWIPPTLAAALHLAHAAGDKATLLAMPAEARENAAIDRFHARLAVHATPSQDGSGAIGANETSASSGRTTPVRHRREAAREIIEELLVLPRWPLHVGETLMQGDIREIASLLPFVVPAYDIEEGIRHGNQTRALRGAFQFSADLLMTWIGGRVEASLALPQLLPLARNGERAMLGMLHRGLETLGDSGAVSLPLTEWGATEPPRMAATLPDTDIPLRYRPQARQARNGEVVPVALPNVPRAGLVHLPREDRVIPVGASGHVVWELDWDGHIVGAVGDTRLGGVRQKILQDLRQPAVPPGQADVSTLADGTTVTSMTRWLDAHAAASLPRGASSADYADTILERLMDCDEENRDERDIFEELWLAHSRSETFRLITHRATPRPDVRRLRFDIRPGATPAYAPERHVITLPPKSELAEIEYLGATGSVHFNPRDVWIHEFIHAMTLLTDPPPAQANAHRGPVVYLTDRILYEINRPTPERIAYAHATSYTHQRMAPDLKLLAERVVRENLLLDERLAHRTPVLPGTLVGGTPVAQRTTVVAAQRIEAVVRAAVAERTSRAPFLERLFARLHANTVFEGEQTSAHLRLVRNFVEHARLIYDGNSWARGFLDAWLDRDGTTQWTIHRFSRILADREGMPCRVNAVAHRIELSYAESFAYLCPTGTKPYTMQRRVATLLAELGLPARTRTPHAGFDIDTERGAVVYVENKLLGLASDSEERRIAARIWRIRPPTLPSTDIPVNPTRARRVANDEDRYLASICAPRQDGTCVCS
ncbi:MAG: PipA/GogA/GtgA family type III secretion system effector, partial [Janthinobacterium lividum]